MLLLLMLPDNGDFQPNAIAILKSSVFQCISDIFQSEILSNYFNSQIFRVVELFILDRIVITVGVFFSLISCIIVLYLRFGK